MKKLEIIPQHTYTYGDGVPAYKSGEWPGSKSSHFKGSKLILKPIQNKERPFKIGHSIHFPQRYSKEYKFIPCRRKLYPIVHEDIYKPKKIRVNIDEGNKTKEWNVENKMTRKKRILSLYEQRNGMINSNLGDKTYKNVDNSPDFFKEGGLIVGSTNRINYNKTTRKGEDNFYQTLDLDIKVLNSDKIWNKKLENENLFVDKEYVKNLNQWEENNLETNDKKDKDKNDKKK